MFQPANKAELIKLIENLDISLGDIDTSLITDMSYLFYKVIRSDFSGIEKWDMRGVEDISGMFAGADIFNEDISSWDMPKLRFANRMFEGASSFEADLSSWDLKNVSTAWMFLNCDLASEKRPANIEKLYHPQSLKELKSLVDNDKISLADIDISSVGNSLAHLFYNSQRKDFSGIEQWDTSGIEDMVGVFENATFFGGGISSWDVSGVKNMTEMFYKATKFNDDLSSWNTSNVQFMGSVFKEAKSFNGDITTWDTSSVVNMASMFEMALKFNADISNWDVSSVEDFSAMFSDAINFNADLSGWDIAAATNMSAMFKNANKYSHDLSMWQIREECDTKEMFNDTHIKANKQPTTIQGVAQEGDLADDEDATDGEEEADIEPKTAPSEPSEPNKEADIKPDTVSTTDEAIYPLGLQSQIRAMKTMGVSEVDIKKKIDDYYKNSKTEPKNLDKNKETTQKAATQPKKSPVKEPKPKEKESEPTGISLDMKSGHMTAIVNDRKK